MTAKTSRRTWLTTAAVGAAGLGVIRHERSLASQDAAATPAGGTRQVVGQADAPRWAFIVLAYEDPYTGKLTRPQEPELGMRYVAAEVQILNGSDQPLEFSSSDIRLRDEQGVEYPGGLAVGSEPRITPQNLPGGERTRGWVWFGVPVESVITELKLSAPSPQLRVALPFPSIG